MDPIIATTTTAVVAGQLIAQFIALLDLLVRLCARLRWEHAHRRLLVELAQALPDGATLHERRIDGTALAVTRPRTLDRPHA